MRLLAKLTTVIAASAWIGYHGTLAAMPFPWQLAGSLAASSAILCGFALVPGREGAREKGGAVRE